MLKPYGIYFDEQEARSHTACQIFGSSNAVPRPQSRLKRPKKKNPGRPSRLTLLANQYRPKEN